MVKGALKILIVFLNRDPINEPGSRLINSISVPLNQWEETNRYRFVGNESTGWVDRLGLERMRSGNLSEEALDKAKKLEKPADVARKTLEEGADDSTRPGWIRRALGRVFGKTTRPSAPTPDGELGTGMGCLELLRRCRNAEQELANCLTEMSPCCREEEKRAAEICSIASRVCDT